MHRRSLLLIFWPVPKPDSLSCRFSERENRMKARNRSDRPNRPEQKLADPLLRLRFLHRLSIDEGRARWRAIEQFTEELLRWLFWKLEKQIPQSSADGRAAIIKAFLLYPDILGPSWPVCQDGNPSLAHWQRSMHPILLRAAIRAAGDEYGAEFSAQGEPVHQAQHNSHWVWQGYWIDCVNVLLQALPMSIHLSPDPQKKGFIMATFEESQNRQILKYSLEPHDGENSLLPLAFGHSLIGQGLIAAAAAELGDSALMAPPKTGEGITFG